ncbi:hypothetical protein [Pseudonocardia kunmingensis]|uniref:Uncharacterized protein n=1 Tax=Pseudonocardia kunmingensis TaxID=630975 RepID=A0A543CX64_9PSEU|nr:hypothetical protein [Pseudonocardia kunmingensis]TQM01690.1 hypothetical protein FB558_8591 [Pseudonocardia kunmingensis]
MPATSDLDRSTAFTILLHIDPGFANLETTAGLARVTAFLRDWACSNATDMYRFGIGWVQANPLTTET